MSLLLMASLLTLTFVAFFASLHLYKWSKRWPALHPLCHPLVSGSLLVAIPLWLMPINYEHYREANGLLYQLLGPATVALAIPLHNQFHHIKGIVKPLLIALCFGAIFSVICALLVAWLLGASPETLLALTSKSVTTAIAIGIAETIAAQPGLVAGVVIFTGVFGAIIIQPLLSLFNISDDRVIGFALGINCHGAGTVKAFEISQRCGSFSSLAMSMTGILTAMLLPWIVLLATSP